ncbi:IQ domain-containing protein/DUF4005 domain-containing protein [Cephalotus follicularis]|uniref:IQ domain-containing protein/DUF4005 domain-containing protein n=1 Tax=Cephalotus follicularis TaxID=3775 RepID=A0A1Q3CM86_CEPFO|nr:IQ domain-containing protein/DUF4005 domain-containing protein [Cephalotus follicularis]
MGKASKWVINFLLGKKEEENKKIDSISLFEEYVTSIPTVIVSETPTCKRRWSFGRSASKKIVHKCSKSLDTIPTTPLVTHAILESEKQQNNNTVVAVVHNSSAKTAVATMQAPQYAAATKIQAAFRSYLARRALCALRGLVKLQALVRGHQVRKQTTATVRRIHTLMAIQARARFHRIKMAVQESQLVTKSQSTRHRNFPQDNGFKGVDREEIHINLFVTCGFSKSKHGYLNHSPTPRRASFRFEPPVYVHSMCPDCSQQPKYMANTESSRAKFRSQSEPKQRPKTKRNAAMDQGEDVSLDAQSQHSSSQSKRIPHKNRDTRFAKLYRSKKSVKGSECDANNTTAS